MINLPNVRGQIKKNLPLSRMSWLKVGGPAEILFKPKDILDLQEFLQELIGRYQFSYWALVPI